MKLIDKEVMSKVNFKVNDCMEFACAFMVVGQKDMLLNRAKEFGFTPDPKDLEIINKAEANLSKFMKREMEYFLRICKIEVIIMGFIADNEEIREVPSLLKLMEKSDETIFFNYLGGIFMADQLPELNIGWDRVKNSIDLMLEYIENAKVSDTEAKERLIECYKNPEETKERLCFIFKQFYEKSYRPIEDSVISLCYEFQEKYKNLFLKNPYQFMEKYFINFFKAENESFQYRVNIHISLFHQISFWTINLHDYKEKVGWAVLGARSCEFYSNMESKDRVDKFLKALSDKKRVSMIKLLSNKAYYGYEIAAKLDLTPATVNYHMDFLIDADIVSFDRDENKVYFILEKEKVRGLLKDTEKILLNE